MNKIQDRNSPLQSAVAGENRLYPLFTTVNKKKKYHR